MIWKPLLQYLAHSLSLCPGAWLIKPATGCHPYPTPTGPNWLLITPINVPSLAWYPRPRHWLMAQTRCFTPFHRILKVPVLTKYHEPFIPVYFTHFSTTTGILHRQRLNYLHVESSIDSHNEEKMLFVFVFWGCHYTAPQTGGAYTIEIYFLTVLETWSLKSRCCRVGFLWSLSPWLMDGCLLPVSSPGLPSCVTVS